MIDDDPGTDELFDLPPADPEPKRSEGRGKDRLQRPDRDQVTLRPTDLESLRPADRRVREVWAFVEDLDLSAFHDRIRAVEGHGGRPAIDPAILVALWLHATLEGVGSARALERLCDEHDADRWLCGGVGVNHHTLADFRTTGADLLDRLLPELEATKRRHGADPDEAPASTTDAGARHLLVPGRDQSRDADPHRHPGSGRLVAHPGRRLPRRRRARHGGPTVAAPDHSGLPGAHRGHVRRTLTLDLAFALPLDNPHLHV